MGIQGGAVGLEGGRSTRRARAGFTMLEIVMAMGVLGVALAAHFSGQLMVNRSGASSAESELAVAELASCMEDLLSQSVENKLTGYPSQRFWPDPDLADTDWSGAADYGPRWLVPAYSFGSRVRQAQAGSGASDGRQELFKTRTAALREQRVFVAYPGLGADERATVPGPDPAFVPPAGLEVLLMIEWVQSRSERRASSWNDQGRPLEAWSLDGSPCDPFELEGSDLRSAVLSTYQLAR